MIRKIMLFVLLAVTALFVSCRTVPDNNDVPFIVLYRHFIKSGIKVQYLSQLEKENVGAQAAFTFHIGSRDIGIYKFDCTVQKQKRKLDRVSDTGILYVRGHRYNAIRNGSYVMIDHDTHQDREKIEKAFKTFGKE